jgi:serine/threonine protein kinase
MGGSLVNPHLRSKHPKSADMVVIKQFKPKRAEESQTAAFLQEVAILSALAFHPNVVSLIGYCQPPSAALVMPLYQGDLHSLIHDPSKRYNSLNLIDMVDQICSVMQAIHEMGIAHRDLKPKNVLLEKREQSAWENAQKPGPGNWSASSKTSPPSYHLRLTDFGLAFVGKDAKTLDNLETVQIKGLSYPYAPPEALSGTANLKTHHQSAEFFQSGDVYSFGITLWEMISRKIPWEEALQSSNSQEIIKERVLRGERPIIPAMASSSAKEDEKLVILKALIQECWDPVSGNRPSFKKISQQIRSYMAMVNFPIVESWIV